MKRRYDKFEKRFQQRDKIVAFELIGTGFFVLVWQLMVDANVQFACQEKILLCLTSKL